ncbi:hypothetical protein AYO20_11032 [Fonsecaea nubica]|uniref:Heterokaryon incompatibility domain-containing protein n=1 Tax=Fonsecaea nubica TaxID=856822 RepID=A0A178C125_9EURO|nr:hypothetical protein AYO20_11032 [Fonsecaea nubica]OAL23164.1 hypothetical protein AYO20_11032 [Fonsecaea nubica]
MCDTAPRPPPFEYEPLDPQVSGKCIRLLHPLPLSDDGVIRCTLENNVSIAEQPVPPYTCLSYEWGDDVDHTHWIEVNGKCLEVSRNLFDFLKSLLQQQNGTGLQGLWIDAIAINQKDQKEKSVQVDQMHDIFRQASEVLSWLGPAAHDSDELFHFLESLDIPVPEGASDADTTRSLERKMWYELQHRFFDAGHRIHRAANHLCNRTYWGRMWIVQEMLLARRLHLVCGSKRTRWLRFAIVLEALLSKQIMFKHLLWISRRSPVEPILQHWLRGCDGAEPEDIQTLFTTFATFHCSEPRDKVYALRSLSCDSNLIEVNYESPIEDVLLQVLRVFRRQMLYVEFAAVCEMFRVNLWRLFPLFDEGQPHPSRGANKGPMQSVAGLIQDTSDSAVPPKFSVDLGTIKFGGSRYQGGVVYSWTNLIELSRNGRLKQCNCAPCQKGWQAIRFSSSSGGAESIDPSLQLNCETDRFDIAQSTGVILFYQQRGSGQERYLAPFATGIMLRKVKNTFSVLSRWNYDFIFDSDPGSLYVLLYHDPEVRKLNYEKSLPYTRSVSYTMSQLWNFVSHRSPGFSSGLDKDIGLSALDEVEGLPNVSIQGTMANWR